MKVICIICVVAIHTLGWFFPIDSLWQIIQPVPIFFIILGFNRANSFKRNNLQNLYEIYSFKYFKNMFIRLVFPLILINLICFLIDIILFFPTGFHINGWSNTYNGIVSWGATSTSAGPVSIFYFLIGAPYFPGPGSFFVLILMQFILIFPLVYKLFIKSPLAGLILCFLIDLGFQFAAPYISLFDEYHFLFSGIILRYISVIGLGIWFTSNKKLFSRQNLFVIIFAVPAFFILLCFYWGIYFLPEFVLNNPIFNAIFKTDGAGYSLQLFRTYPWWGKANPLTYCFPALIFLLFINILPHKLNEKKLISRSIYRFFKKYSKLTYHIFLVQIVYFFINIPVSQGYSVSVNESFFESFIRPLVRPFRIKHSWEFDFSLLNRSATFEVILLKLLIIFVNILLISLLAFGFYKIESFLKKPLERTVRKN